jgi:hypothetical protein
VEGFTNIFAIGDCCNTQVSTDRNENKDLYQRILSPFTRKFLPDIRGKNILPFPFRNNLPQENFSPKLRKYFLALNNFCDKYFRYVKENFT